MSEAGFALYNRAFPIVVELLYALCLSMFLRPFLGDRRWQKAAAVFTLHLAASLIWDRLPMPQGTFTLIVTLLLLIAARLLELKKSLELVNNSESSLSIMSAESPMENTLNMLNDIRQFCNEREQEHIDLMVNLFSMFSTCGTMFSS